MDDNRHQPTEDDGSLAFLRIEPQKGNRQFNCSETRQQQLANLTFWVVDYIEGVKTKFGEERYLVKIKFELNAPDSDARKFFTNSQEIKYTLDEIRKRDAFPRKVTMRAMGNRYYLE